MTVADRRTILLGVGGAGVAAVAGCNGGDGDGGRYGAGPSPSKQEATPEQSPTADSDGAAALAKVSDVPVGGGVVLARQKVVLTQPAEGEIKGFSAVCTHQGCALADVSDGMINCECHGSKFSAEDGAVRNGPATRSLPAVQVRVEGDEIFRE